MKDEPEGVKRLNDLRPSVRCSAYSESLSFQRDLIARTYCKHLFSQHVSAKYERK